LNHRIACQDAEALRSAPSLSGSVDRCYTVNLHLLVAQPPMMLVALAGWYLASFGFQFGILPFAVARVAAALY
jgi:hypothetical protein